MTRLPWWRRMFCSHRWAWVRNTHGDEINLCGGRRTVFLCERCGAARYSHDYITREMAIRVYDPEKP